MRVFLTSYETQLFSRKLSHWLGLTASSTQHRSPYNGLESSLFGPHVDRPFMSDDNAERLVAILYEGIDVTTRRCVQNGDWQRTRPPPMNYPISVQVVWLLDNFNCERCVFLHST